MTQATLGDISVEEGGSSDEEDETPRVDPAKRSGLPRRLPHNQETEDEDDEEDDPDPMFRGPRVHGPCPVCGERSPVSWRCVDCGKLFDGVTTKGRDTDTAITD